MPPNRVNNFSIWVSHSTSRAVQKRKPAVKPTRTGFSSSGDIPKKGESRRRGVPNRRASPREEPLLTLPDSKSIPLTTSGRIEGVSGGFPRPPISYTARATTSLTFFARHKIGQIGFCEKNVTATIVLSRPVSHHTNSEHTQELRVGSTLFVQSTIPWKNDANNSTC